MKQLVLLRHGQALGLSESGAAEDSKRPLSAAGKNQAAVSAKRLLQLDFRPEVIIASPYLRAAQTAAVIVSFFPGARRIDSPDLASGNGPAIMELLDLELKEAASAMLIGHQPLLGILAGFLLKRENFELATGGFVYLKLGSAPAPATRPPDGSELVEFFSP